MNKFIRCVADKTDLKYDDGSQQDAAESLESLLLVLSLELKDNFDFQVCLQSHKGMGGVNREFCTIDGKCPKCKLENVFQPQPFNILQLAIPPNHKRGLTLDKILHEHFSVQNNDESMKCDSCCPHPGSTCPHTGDCARAVRSRNVITKWLLFFMILSHPSHPISPDVI